MLSLPLSDEAATRLASDPQIIWHQRFRLSENVSSPGAHEIDVLLDRYALPESLAGLSVLDIGTSNGGAAFLAEAMGADRVVAVDIYEPGWFGFDRIHTALGSRVEFVRASLYELPDVLKESFDLVFCMGVLYHLRHPLLAIDALRTLTRGRVYVETAVNPEHSDTVRTEFYAGEYSGDASNWFIPSVRCLRDWFASSGFEVERTLAWPQPDPSRALLVGTPTEPTFLTDSYEVRLHVQAPLSESSWLT